MDLDFGWHSGQPNNANGGNQWCLVFTQQFLPDFNIIGDVECNRDKVTKFACETEPLHVQA